MKKPIKRINKDGDLLELNQRLNRWEIISWSGFSFDDISKGYKRESKRNYKLNNK